jgi:hypothetical protein
LSGEPAARPAFVAALAGALLAALALSLQVASREWFTRDDFAFLAYVQDPERWSFRAAFLPLGERFWPFYRPLGMETFFWAGFQLFGLEAFGYFATSIALHFASGLLVLRLARRFGFAAPVALATAALAVTRPPSLLEIYWGSVFMYVAASACALLAAERFLARVGGAGVASQLLSCAALAAALLCNEIAVAVPAVLALAALAAGSARPDARGLARLARALLPQAAITAAYLLFRFAALAPMESSALYTPALGAHVAGNALALLAATVGTGVPAFAWGVAAALALAALAAGRARASVRAAARAGGACLAWTALLVALFALLPFPQPRWAMNLEAPLCLAFGALLEAARRALPARRARAFETALAALVIGGVPWAALAARGEALQGARARQLVDAIESARIERPDAANFVLLYGAAGLADARAADELRLLLFEGGALRAVYPQSPRVLRFHDLARRAPRNAIRPDSIYLVLRPDLGVERAAAELLAREFPRRFDGP